MKDSDTVIEIEFLPATLPNLPDGEYQVEVTQDVESPASGRLSSASTSFWVGGPRFSLNPDEVYSQSPPAGSLGTFGTELPHVALRRKTLPWERSLDGQEPPPPPGVPTPWLALLVVDQDSTDSESDPPGRVQSGTVADLLPERPNGGGHCPPSILGPQLPDPPLDPWESETDPCHFIDLPRALYMGIVPGKDELRLLAHARTVRTGNQVLEDIKKDGSFSVVFANRFPRSSGEPAAAGSLGRENTACLVSLEGFQDYLYPAEVPEKYTAVRLAVLSSWSFWDTGGDNLQQRLEALVVGPLNRLGRGYFGDWRPDQPTPTPSCPHPFGSYTEYAFTMGFTALRHATRIGEKTVSWYRGPLRPFFTPHDLENAVHRSADAALRYDPLSGMFDVSYAAAWQLGRLLALQSKPFALAWYQRRNKVRGELDTQRIRRRVSASHPADEGKLAGRGVSLRRHALRRDVVGWLTRPEMADVLRQYEGLSARANRRNSARVVTGARPLPPPDEPDLDQQIEAAFHSSSGTRRATATAEVAEGKVTALRIDDPGSGYTYPPTVSFSGGGGAGATGAAVVEHGQVTELAVTDGGSGYETPPDVQIASPEADRVISDFLGSLQLLEGVPLGYLVPDAVMLPRESFRFFYVDPIWIDRLIEGALSIGRADGVQDFTLNRLEETFMRQALDHSRSAGLNTRSRKLAAFGLEVVGEAAPPADLTAVTGFLLRSSLVPGWKGLEMRAYENIDEPARDPLAPLRLDRLAPDILFGLFPAKIRKVVIQQPSQGLRFGASGGPGDWSLEDLRYLSGDAVGAPFKRRLEVSNRPDERVVDVAKLAESMAAIKEEIRLPAGQTVLNAADFAIEMVRGAAYVVFTAGVPAAKAFVDTGVVSRIEEAEL